MTYGFPGPNYDVLGDVLIMPNVTLTGEPGVVLRMASFRDTLQGGDFPDRTEIDVQGTLVAQGTVGDSIYFVSSDGSPNAWGQLRFESGSHGLLQRLCMQGPYKAVNVRQGGSVSVIGCTVRQCAFGVDSPDGSALIQDSSFEGISAGNSDGTFGIRGGPKCTLVASDSLAPIATVVSRFWTAVYDVSARNLVATNCSFGFQNCFPADYCTAINCNTGFTSCYVLNSIAAQNNHGVSSCSFVANTDSWANGSNFEFTTLGPSLASFNPFFVDLAAHDYHLSAGSVFKAFSDRGMEIGAYGPGPGQPVVSKAVSWGRIKSSFR